MKIYLAYSKNYHDILKEEKAKLIISYGRKHGTSGEPTLPDGFDEYLIDSGGFQLAMGTNERDIYLGAYCLWLELLVRKYGDKIKGYMALDTKDPSETLSNLREMREYGLNPIAIWHDGWPEDALEYICSTCDYIAIGGLVGSGFKSKGYYRKLFERITQKYPEIKIHMLGIGIIGTHAFKSFRPYSVDFSTWTVPARFGHDLVYDKKQILKEVKLPAEVRQRLRDDNDYENELIRRAIRSVISLETKLEELDEPYQQSLF